MARCGGISLAEARLQIAKSGMSDSEAFPKAEVNQYLH